MGPCGCHTGFKHPYATPVETAIRISKPPKEPIRDPQGGCTIISKAHRGSYTCGPVSDKYGPVRLSMGRLRTKLVGSPCLKVVDAYGSKHILKIVRAHTAAVRLPTCPLGFSPYKTRNPARELNLSGALVINPSKMVQTG